MSPSRRADEPDAGRERKARRSSKLFSRNCKVKSRGVQAHEPLMHRARSGMNAMLDQQDRSATDAAAELRDEDGAIRPEFLEHGQRGDRAAATPRALQTLAGELHEADTGDLIEALDPELRPRFIELLGREFDFTALTEVEDDGPRGDPRGAAVRRPSPKASAISIPTMPRRSSRTLPEEEQAEVLEQMPQPERGAVEQHPALSGGLRRPPHADRVHRGVAVLDGRRRDRPHARDRRPAGPVLRALRGGRRPEAARRGRRSTACCAPSGRFRSPS